MKTVLLIEPNALLAQSYTQVLQRSGYRVMRAKGAQDAVHAADTATPDVVVLEIQLVAHSGIEFLHEFRSYAEWRDIPVLVVTNLPPASTEPLQGVLLNQLGVSSVLYKPQTSLRSLVGRVRSLVAA